MTAPADPSPDPPEPDRAVLLGVARVGFALLGLAALVTQCVEQARTGRSLVNFFSFFTVESNIAAAIVLLITGIGALRGAPAGRLTLLRGAVTLYMVVTGLVYAALLRGVDVQLTSSWINSVLHYVMPLVLLVDWLVAPRSSIPLAKALWWLAYPLVYGAYSLIRGSITGWYPYPFLDAGQHSAGMLVLNMLGVAVLCAILLVVLVRLPHRESGTGMEAERDPHRTVGP